MKKIIQSALGLAALAFTSLSWATPVYTGNTAADFGSLPGAPSSNAAGYYIWSDESQENWSVRWTGNDFGSVTWYDWFGTVELTNLVNGTVTSVKFESGHPDSVNYVTDFLGTDQDFIAFNGYAGPHYDGFDFFVDSSVVTVLDFELGSSMFQDMTPGSQAQESMGIYIGRDFSEPMVQVQERQDGRIVQRFETVPEPGTMLLLATGLIGMGATRLGRRKV
ncbi:MAG: PEP-CTERM sorting domain-containing protein [Candidatus Thiodiazotropha sp. (ex Monitilora ramsayi)]|nr:PEP-CTERM sorting domain-containing protein [Candidatus Thiodiazotropha sp. (ex Monitilora ramsayi)]